MMMSLDEGEATTKEIYRLIGKGWPWFTAPAVVLVLAYVAPVVWHLGRFALINLGGGW